MFALNVDKSSSGLLRFKIVFLALELNEGGLLFFSAFGSFYSNVFYRTTGLLLSP